MGCVQSHGRQQCNADRERNAGGTGRSCRGGAGKGSNQRRDVEHFGFGFGVQIRGGFSCSSRGGGEVLFQAGDRVKTGQLLVQLVDRREVLAEKQAAVQLEAAGRLLKRYQRTEGTGAVSATVIDDARIAYRQAELALAQAKEQLRDRTVRAAFDGVVGIALIDPGDRVALDTPLTTLDLRSPLMVEFPVPEQFLTRLKVEQPVSMQNISLAERVFTGKIQYIDSRVDELLRTVKVRAAVPNTDDLLRPGMSLDLKLTLQGEPALIVPELAVQWSREGSHVWAVRNGTSVKVPARVVQRREGRVLVTGQLRPGEPVVVEGVQRLRPGRAVKILQAAPQTNPQLQPAKASGT